MSFDPTSLTYDEAGLLPCIAQEAETGEVLMLAWMNAVAVARTLETGRVTYWSRSRQAFWVKGETSGGTGLPYRAAVVFLHRGAGRG